MLSDTMAEAEEFTVEETALVGKTTKSVFLRAGKG
jgi:hypothetical protein